MKIYIDDPNLRQRELPETEIDANERIRFEIGDNKFTVYIEDNGIEIIKVNTSMNDRIKITPAASNVINID